MIEVVRTWANSSVRYNHVYDFEIRTYEMPILSGEKVRQTDLIGDTYMQVNFYVDSDWQENPPKYKGCIRIGTFSDGGEGYILIDGKKYGYRDILENYGYVQFLIDRERVEENLANIGKL